MNQKGFTAEEVARHGTPDDCWVICEGRVLDVTGFLARHPGGVGALSKAGRAGCDVTTHFERIGHSVKAREVMRSMQIGRLIVADSNDEDTRAAATTAVAVVADDHDNHDKDERERAILWHADRRRIILERHPEVAALQGHNPLTPFLGFLTLLVHCYCCVLAQRVSWLGTFSLAYTVGAVCKMWQFAICHDICHGTAGSLIERYSFVKETVMQLCSLPAFGGKTHMYYSFQHIGHHSSLGSQSIYEIGGGNPSGGLTSKIFLMPDSDGDAFAIGTMSLGKILLRWGDSLDAEGHLQKVYYGEEDDESVMKRVHSNTFRSKVLKCIGIQIGHIGFHAGLLLPNLFSLSMVPPLSLAIMVAPEAYIVERTRRCIIWFGSMFTPEFRAEDFRHTDTYLREGIRVLPSLALYNWACVVLAWWLLFYVGGDGNEVDSAWTVASVLKGCMYLYLSELFLYGFLLHPFAGYFLGVHRSGGQGFKKERGGYSFVSRAEDSIAEKASCQPTMSTYSTLASVASLYLTHHVEHHDFPNVPWSRLCEISKLAPEFYRDLEQSHGFCATIWRWLQHSGEWSYACQ
mgnify:CR=1 FL=1|jgi:fatty acid desaturase